MPNTRILIVEDDPMMADTVASMVELFGYEVMTATTPQQALEMLPEVQPGLIMLDLNLPGGMNGIDICRAVRARPEFDGTHVIIVSAEDHPDTIRAAKEAGAARYLVKPVGLDDMEKAIAETLAS